MAELWPAGSRGALAFTQRNPFYSQCLGQFLRLRSQVQGWRPCLGYHILPLWKLNQRDTRSSPTHPLLLHTLVLLHHVWMMTPARTVVVLAAPSTQRILHCVGGMMTMISKLLASVVPVGGALSLFHPVDSQCLVSP